jgi:hypothetical protein
LAWVSFIMCCIHHSIWIESHDRFQTGSGHQDDRADRARAPDHLILFTAASFNWYVDTKSIKLATFRTLVVIFIVIARETSTSFTGWPSVTFLQTLFLLATVSTLAAWTHCQHLETNSLSNVLLSTVVASTCGILVDSIQQMACLLLAAMFAIALEILG